VLLATLLIDRPGVSAVVLGVSAGAVGAALAFASFLPLLHADSGALRQFFYHASKYRTRGFLPDLLVSWRHDKFSLILLALLLCSGPLLGRVAAPASKRPLARYWVVPLLGVGFVLATSPSRSFYLWFTGPYLLALTAAGWTALRANRQWRRLAVFGTVTAVALAAGMVPKLVQTLALWGLPADQSLAASEARLGELVPLGTTVATTDYWWVLAEGRHVVDLSCAQRALHWDHVQYVVINGRGSGRAGRPQSLPPALAAEVKAKFRVISWHLDDRPVRVLGWRLTNSSWGFGAVVFQRTHPGRVPTAHPQGKPSE
jgi:hypothetical protein